MQYAFLVLAARAPIGLERFVRLFDFPECIFFIHVDAKSIIDPFQALSERRGRLRINLLRNRQRVFWGGFNMILAELDLIRAALDVPGAQRLILLSDDSFPIKSPLRILEELAADTLWIGQDASEILRWRYDGFYFFDSDTTNPQHRELRKRAFTDSETYAVAELSQLQTTGKAPLSQFFRGSQWWSLTRDAALQICQMHESDPWRRQSFRFSCIPDEHYIQTLVGTSKNRWQTRASPMYVDFGRSPKPYIFSDLGELAPALGSEYLFVRKVAQEPGFLDQLASHLT